MIIKNEGRSVRHLLNLLGYGDFYEEPQQPLWGLDSATRLILRRDPDDRSSEFILVTNYRQEWTGVVSKECYWVQSYEKELEIARKFADLAYYRITQIDVINMYAFLYSEKGVLNRYVCNEKETPNILAKGQRIEFEPINSYEATNLWGKPDRVFDETYDPIDNCWRTVNNILRYFFEDYSSAAQFKLLRSHIKIESYILENSA
ncbi:MAG: hypothetical protein AB8G22_04215 [Saprospiraceae bacterium]